MGFNSGFKGLRYRFGINNWRLEEIREVDSKTRKVLTAYKMLHPTADINKRYTNRNGGGRCLLQTEATYKAEKINIVEYLNTKYTEDQFVNIVKSHESNQPNVNSTITKAAKFAEELNQLNENSDIKKEDVPHIKARLGSSLKKKWKSRVMDGQYIRNIDRQHISEEDTFLWLLIGDLKGETETEIITVQDQALQTKYHVTKLIQTETDSKCGLCKQFDETV